MQVNAIVARYGTVPNGVPHGMATNAFVALSATAIADTRLLAHLTRRLVNRTGGRIFLLPAILSFYLPPATARPSYANAFANTADPILTT